MNVRVGPCRVETEILQRLKPVYRNFHVLHGVNEQEEPVVAQHFRAFQR